MRKVIIAILSVIAIATIVLPEGEYGPVTITSYAAEGQFNSNGLQANNLGIPIDEFVDAPATAPVPFGQLVDAPMTAPSVETSTTTTAKETTTTVGLVPAPETAPEVLDTAPATAPTTSTSTTTTTTTVTTTTTTTTTSASTVLADMKCADGAELRVSEDSNGKVEIEASGEKDLLKEIFGFIKDLFS